MRSLVFDRPRNAAEALSLQFLFLMAVQLPAEAPSETRNEMLAGGRNDALQRGELSAGQIDAAEALARKRFQEWFRSRTVPDQTWDMMPFMAGGLNSRDANAVCIDGPWTTPPRLPDSNAP